MEGKSMTISHPFINLSQDKGKEKVADDQVGDDLTEAPVTMQSLPPHILFEVLVQIPSVKSVVSSMLVSPTWQALITDPQFAVKHFSKASSLCPLLFVRNNDAYHQTMYLLEGNKSVDLYPYQKHKFTSKIELHLPNMRLSRYHPSMYPCKYEVSDFVVSSCEGLIAWTLSYDYFPIIICNPISGEYFMVDDAQLEPIFSATLRSFFIGIGFNAQTRQYELLRLSILPIWDSISGSRKMRWFTDVLTFGSEPWDWIHTGDVSESVGDFVYAEVTQVININSVIYWMHQGNRSICSFNFEQRFFEVLPILNMDGGRGDYQSSTVGGLGELEGNVCVSLISNYDGHVEIWSIKNTNGGNVIWVLYYYIETAFIQLKDLDPLRVKECCRLMKHLENGKLLLQRSNDSFIIYDTFLGTETCQFRLIEDAQIEGMKSIHHKPSLISLGEALRCDNIPAVFKGHLRS